MRSLEEIKARCLFILDDKDIVSLVKVSSSPTAAYDMVFTKTNDINKAKAGRWLAVLRRDYPEEYNALDQVKLNHVHNDTVKTD